MKKLAFLLLLFLSSNSLSSQNFSLFDQKSNEDIEEEIRQLLDSSNVYYSKGNYVMSLETNIKLVKLAALIDDSRYLYKGYRYLGYDYLVLNDTVLARESFEKSGEYAKISKNDTVLAESFMDLANFYSSAQDNYSKAKIYHDESISLFEKIADSVGMTKAYYNAIISSFDANKYEDFYKYLVKLSQPALEKHLENSFKMGLNNYWGLHHKTKKQYKRADSYFLKSIEVATQEDYPIELATAYRELSDSYFNQNRYREAYQQRIKYEEQNEKNIEVQQNAQSESASAKFQLSEYKRKNKEIELENKLQTASAENQKKISWILSTTFLISLFLIVGLYVAFRKRKQLVHSLKELNRQYLNAKFRSEQLAKAKSKFFSTVSHELRTPLYGVIGLSTILLEDEKLQSHQKDLTSLKFSADYLLALINDVLQINKIDSNSLENDISSFNVRELIQSITSSFEYMRLQNKNTLHIHVSENLPKLVDGNSVRLSQILMNLIGNACKFTENGEIHISADVIKTTKGREGEKNQALIRFTIEDSGIGIAKEKQASIFDEFAQIESIDYSYQGTGLGLPIVKKLLNLSNSEIHLTSELGKGSTFSFDLLFAVSKQTSFSQEVKLLDTSMLNGKKILIVEDNRINQIVTSKILERNGIEFTLANNGQEAVDLVFKHTFDLILMDLNMPVKNGIDATYEIRQFNSKTPIIALTAVEAEEVRNQVFTAGMNDIVIKPYDVTQFTHTILKNLGAKGLPLVSSKKRSAV